MGASRFSSEMEVDLSRNDPVVKMVYSDTAGNKTILPFDYKTKEWTNNSVTLDQNGLTIKSVMYKDNAPSITERFEYGIRGAVSPTRVEITDHLQGGNKAVFTAPEGRTLELDNAGRIVSGDYKLRHSNADGVLLQADTYENGALAVREIPGVATIKAVSPEDFEKNTSALFSADRIKKSDLRPMMTIAAGDGAVSYTLMNNEDKVVASIDGGVARYGRGAKFGDFDSMAAKPLSDGAYNETRINPVGADALADMLDQLGPEPSLLQPLHVLAPRVREEPVRDHTEALHEPDAAPELAQHDRARVLDDHGLVVERHPLAAEQLPEHHAEERPSAHVHETADPLCRRKPSHDGLIPGIRRAEMPLVEQFHTAVFRSLFRHVASARDWARRG